MVKITVDGKSIDAEEGTSLLQTCLDNGIYIPNLCFLKEMENPTGSCRMCFVELEGEDGLVTSCQTKVRAEMVVKTDTTAVRNLQKTVFQLLFSAHHMDCKHCLARKKCELQKVAKLLGVKLKAKKINELGRDLDTDRRHPCFQLLPARCILCQKCLYVCKQKNANPLLKIVRNGFDTAIDSAWEGDPADAPCHECKACIEVCPVSAIVPLEVAVYGL